MRMKALGPDMPVTITRGFLVNSKFSVAHLDMITHAQHWQTRADRHVVIALAAVIGFRSTLHTPPSPGSRRYVPPLALELAIANRMRDLKAIMMVSEARTQGRISQG